MPESSRDINLKVTVQSNLVGEVKKDGVLKFQDDYWDVKHVTKHWQVGSVDGKTEQVRLEIWLTRDIEDPEPGAGPDPFIHPPCGTPHTIGQICPANVYTEFDLKNWYDKRQEHDRGE